MTPADHAALSAQLARAIGYEQISVQTCGDYALVHGLWDDSGRDWQHWRTFDYRDPSVALPVLEWLMREQGVSVCFDDEYGQYEIERYGTPRYFDTLPEAILSTHDILEAAQASSFKVASSQTFGAAMTDFGIGQQLDPEDSVAVQQRDALYWIRDRYYAKWKDTWSAEVWHMADLYKAVVLIAE